MTIAGAIAVRYPVCSDARLIQAVATSIARQPPMATRSLLGRRAGLGVKAAAANAAAVSGTKARPA
jgi:hypothetical protein